MSQPRTQLTNKAGRRTSTNPTIQGSSAWLQKLASEVGQNDTSLVPPPNVVALDPDVLARDIQKLYARLRKLESWLLDPHSKYMQYWDFVILSAMFFTSTVTPYEVHSRRCRAVAPWCRLVAMPPSLLPYCTPGCAQVCLIWQPSTFDILFWINLVVNIIFVVDTCFQVSTATRTSTQNAPLVPSARSCPARTKRGPACQFPRPQFFLPYKESAKKGGATIKNHNRIAFHYLETWFSIDFVSVIPFDYVLMAVDIPEDNVCSAPFLAWPLTHGLSVPSAPTHEQTATLPICLARTMRSDSRCHVRCPWQLSLIGATSMLRLLRLIKLVRILRASRIFARWENSISMKYATRELIALLGLVVLTLHWISCLLGMAAQINKASRTGAMAPHRQLTREGGRNGDTMPDDGIGPRCTT